ncbi:cyclophilin-like domain-containing protein [Lactarius deliciosus]|nr:cyclophilin-like domain-containing protein [Lactarius deliciosus]
MVRSRVFMDFSIDGSPVGRVIFELFNDVVPKTSENFRALCTGEKGLSPLSDRPLYYKNSIVHRSIADFMVQAGDFTKRNGTGGESIYGGPFADEDLTHPLDAEGLLCMANRGPNTNSSHWAHTDVNIGKHVVFGKVIRGFDDVVRKVAQVATDEKDRPAVPVIIFNCGELELRKKHTPPPKELSVSASESEDASDGEGEKSRKRHKRRHRSPSSGGEGKADDKRHKRRHKRKHRQDKERSLSKPAPIEESEPSGERKETEEEYDARLEREENERLEAERKRELGAAQANNTNRRPRRGRMKFVDPELHRRR